MNAGKVVVDPPSEYSHRARHVIRQKLLNKQEQHGTNQVASSRASSHHDAESIFSSSSASLFSAPSTLSSSGSIIYQPEKPLIVSLQDALPKTFYDMYQPEIYTTNPNNLFSNGRPKFTKRELIDWELNDVRSLLIIEKLKPEWNGNLPMIIDESSPGIAFRFQLLPLYSTDEFIINTLVQSDIYKEANLDYEFKLTSAKYTVLAARKRHELLTHSNEQIMNLSKPEWRNIIENYLLNLAVETQCRHDFKLYCVEYKKLKNLQAAQQQYNLKKPDMPPPSAIPAPTSSTSLLKKALIKKLQSKNEPQPPLNNTTTKKTKMSLTKEERNSLWSFCQAQVYQRLGLDWKPDRI